MLWGQNIRSFHVVERMRTSSKCQKMKNAPAKCAIILFLHCEICKFVRLLLLSSSWLLKLPICRCNMILRHDPLRLPTFRLIQKHNRNGKGPKSRITMGRYAEWSGLSSNLIILGYLYCAQYCQLTFPFSC